MFQRWRRPARIRRARARPLDTPRVEPLEPRTLLSSYAITPIATRIDPAPGFGENFVFDSLTLAGLGGGQHVGFNASVLELPNGDLRSNGIFVGNPDAITTVYRQGDTAPGASGPFTQVPNGFPVRGQGALAVTGFVDIGETVFYPGVWAGVGELNPLALPAVGSSVGGGAAVNAAGHTAITRGSFLNIAGVDALDLTFQNQDVPPTLNPDDYHLHLSNVAPQTGLINGDDQVPTRVIVQGKFPVPDYEAVWLVGPGGYVSEVASGEFFDVFGLNDAGEVLVRHFVEQISVGGFLKDIYQLSVAKDGQLTPVIRTGDALDGAPAHVEPSIASSASIGGGGHVALYGRDTQLSEDAGIWTGMPGSLSKLAMLGDPAPGLDDAVFSDFGGFAINRNGTVAFFAEATGPGEEEIEGIWFGTPGSVNLAVAEGQTRALTDSRVITITSLFSTGIWFNGHTSGIQDGRPTAFNDDGMIAFDGLGEIAGVSSSVTPGGIFVIDTHTLVEDTGAISGFVWRDDGNGVFDLVEEGEAGVAVELRDNDGNTIGSPVQTDANGAYRFDNLAPGTYRVHVTLPDGATFAPTTGDAEIGGGGLSGPIVIAGGVEADADAGLLFTGPPDVTLLRLHQALGEDPLVADIDRLVDIREDPDETNHELLLLIVEYRDANRIDEATLADSKLLVTRFDGSGLPLQATYSASLTQGLTGATLNGTNDPRELVAYIMEPAFGVWEQEAVGDYLAVTTGTPVRDAAGDEVPTGTLAGLFSIVGQLDPIATLVSGPTVIALKDVGQTVAFRVAYADPGGLDVNEIKFRNPNIDLTFPGLDGGDITLFADKSAATGLPAPTGPTTTWTGHFPFPVVNALGGIERIGLVDSGNMGSVIRDEDNHALNSGITLGGFVIDTLAPRVEVIANSARLVNSGGTDLVEFKLRVTDGFEMPLGQFDAGGSAAFTLGGALAAVVDRAASPDGKQVELTLLADPPGDPHEPHVVAVTNLLDQHDNPLADDDLGSVAAPRGVTTQGEGGGGITFKTQSGSFTLTSDDAQFVVETVGQELSERALKKGLKKIEGIADGLGDLLFTSNGNKAKVKLKGRGDPVSIRNVIGSGEFGHIDLRSGSILGDIDLSDGTTRMLTVNDVMDDHLIQIGVPTANVPAVTITLDRVRNTDLVSLTPIDKLIVTEWIDDGGDPDTITAPWIGQIIVKGNAALGLAGDFDAGLVLSGEGLPAGRTTLGPVKVKGAIDGDWQITGGIKGVTAGSIAPTWNAAATGAVGAVKVLGDASGALDALSLKSLKVGGSLTDASLTLTQAVDPTLKALGNMKVTGDVLRTALRSTGHVGAVTVGSLLSSQLFAGVKPDVTTLPDGLDDFADLIASIKSVTVKGNRAAPAALAFADTLLAAGQLGKIKLLRADTADDGEDFGLAADRIAGVTGLTLPLPALDEPSETSEGDLTIRVL